MTLTKHPESGVYKARVKTNDGRTVTLTTGAKTRAEAERIIKASHLPELEEAAKAGRLTADALSRILAGKKLTLEMAIKDFGAGQTMMGRSKILIHNYAAILNRFGEVTGALNKSVTAVTEKMVYDFINGPGESAASWRRTQLSAINTFFEFCQTKSWVLINPAGTIQVRMDTLTHAQKEKRSRNPFTATELNILESATEAGSFWHTAIIIARRTGLRLGDIAKLEWDSFAVPKKIIVWTEKRDKRVALDLHPSLEKAIGAVAPINKRFVFPEEAEISSDMNRRANLSTYFRRLCEANNIEGKTFHDIRSHYVTACAKAGIPIEHIAVNVGHSSTATTRGYMGKD